MKRLFTLKVFILFVLMSVGAYSLNNFDYTGIAFDGSGNILASTTVGVQIDLIDGGTVQYSETHSGVTTDQFGAYTVTVGTGSSPSGNLTTTNTTKTLKIKSTITGGSGGVWVVSSLLKTSMAVTSSSVGAKKYWTVDGNSGTTAGTDFIGTTDGVAAEMRVENTGTVNNSLVLNANGSVQRDNPSTGGSYVGGNARGQNAVDLQSYRTVATQVANGSYSSLGGGSSNTASGWSSTVGGGQQNTASQDYSIVGGGAGNTASGDWSTVGGGQQNTASGTQTTVGGGYRNTASGYSSTVGGGLDAVADKYGQNAYASGSFTNSGDAQTSVFVVRNETTDATATYLYLDGSSASESMTIPANTTWLFKIYVVGRNADGTANSAGFKIEGAIDDASLLSSTTTQIFGPSGWNAVTVLNGGALKIQVTGAAATTIRWVARVEVVEVGL